MTACMADATFLHLCHFVALIVSLKKLNGNYRVGPFADKRKNIIINQQFWYMYPDFPWFSNLSHRLYV